MSIQPHLGKITGKSLAPAPAQVDHILIWSNSEQRRTGSVVYGNNDQRVGMLRTFFYMSESLMDLATDNPEIVELVEQSKIRNSKRRISGALIFTDRSFVQAIEGPADAIDALKAKIIADPRHTAITILADGPTEKREFGLWSLAYSGADTLIDGKLAPTLAMLGTPERERAIRSLKLLLTASVEQNGWVGPAIDTSLD